MSGCRPPTGGTGSCPFRRAALSARRVAFQRQHNTPRLWPCVVESWNTLMQFRINRSAQPTAAKAPPPHRSSPTDDSAEQPQLAPNDFLDSLLQYAGGGQGNDPYNHTGRLSRR